MFHHILAPITQDRCPLQMKNNAMSLDDFFLSIPFGSFLFLRKHSNLSIEVNTIHIPQSRLWSSAHFQITQRNYKIAYASIPPILIGHHYFWVHTFFFQSLHRKCIVLPVVSRFRFCPDFARSVYLKAPTHKRANKESSTICNLLLQASLRKKAIRIDDDENRERCRMPTAITDFLLPSAFIQMKQ